VNAVVFTAFYYATEAITKVIVWIAVKLLAPKRAFVKEKGREERPSWGWFETKSPYGWSEARWVGRATGIQASIPQLPGMGEVVRASSGPPPVRLYFTFTEAASKDWFKEIEELARRAERKAKEKGEAS
jgi:hypothetical protein